MHEHGSSAHRRAPRGTGTVTLQVHTPLQWPHVHSHTLLPTQSLPQHRAWVFTNRCHTLSPASALCPQPFHSSLTLAPVTCTCLAQHPGLAHEDQDVGSQDGQAEVQQDDGALGFYEPEKAQQAGTEELATAPKSGLATPHRLTPPSVPPTSRRLRRWQGG